MTCKKLQRSIPRRPCAFRMITTSRIIMKSVLRSRIDKKLDFFSVPAQFLTQLLDVLQRAHDVLITHVILHRTRQGIGKGQIRSLPAIQCYFSLDDHGSIKIDVAAENVGPTHRVKTFSPAHAYPVKRDPILNHFPAIFEVLVAVDEIVKDLIVGKSKIDLLPPFDIGLSGRRLAPDSRKK